MARNLIFLAVVLCLSACPKNVESKPVVEGRVVLALKPERETMPIPELATQLETDTDQERTPHIVAVGETPLRSRCSRTTIVPIARTDPPTPDFSDANWGSDPENIV